MKTLVIAEKPSVSRGSTGVGKIRGILGNPFIGRRKRHESRSGQFCLAGRRRNFVTVGVGAVNGCGIQYAHASTRAHIRRILVYLHLKRQMVLIVGGEGHIHRMDDGSVLPSRLVVNRIGQLNGLFACLGKRNAVSHHIDAVWQLIEPFVPKFNA